MKRLENIKEFKELVDCIYLLNQHFFQLNSQSCSEKNERLTQEILQFINDHYTDYDFSISHICEHFHMSESAAYQVFRETIGTSFTSLVEHMRIEKACQMLNEKKYLIKEISLSVGYSNDNCATRA